MIKKIIILFLFVYTFLNINTVHAQNVNNNYSDTDLSYVETNSDDIQQSFYKATVKKVEPKINPETGEKGKVKIVTLEINSGDRKNQEIKTFWIPVSSAEEDRFLLKENDKVIVKYTKINNSEDWSITEKQRINIVWILLLFLIIAIFLVSKWHGIKSLITLFITIFIIINFLVPQINKGYDPLFISIITVILFIIPSLFLSHGINKKTFIAIFGIIFSTIIVAIMSYFTIKYANLTGINTEETFYINLGQTKIDLLNLLLAGIVLGTVGVMDDIAITQSSVVLQLCQSNKKYSWKKIFNKAMKVGNDHISSVINTLFLAYIGAGLPLVILLTQLKIPFEYAIQKEIIITEIIRILIGTIGLVITVPLTTFLSAIIITKTNIKPIKNFVHKIDNYKDFWKNKK